MLFRGGDETRYMYISKCANVRLVRIGPDGEPITVHRAGPNESFAEASVFATSYHCSAEVVRAGLVTRISKSTILAEFQNLEFAISYNQIMSAQVQAYRQRIEILSIRSADKRVYAAIVAGYLDDSILEFSEKIALTHEATYRALRSLVDRGFLRKVSRGFYCLQNVESPKPNRF